MSIKGQSDLQRRIEQRTRDYFGRFSGSYEEPRYLVALECDAQQLVTIADITSPPDLEPDPIYGSVRYDDDLIAEWTEPAVGLGLSYDREHRWAYIADAPSTEIHVRRIWLQDPLELICDHEDAVLWDRV